MCFTRAPAARLKCQSVTNPGEHSEISERPDDVTEQVAVPRFSNPESSGWKDSYSLANCVGEEWKIPAPDTCDAIKKAATTAGTLISLRN